METVVKEFVEHSDYEKRVSENPIAPGVCMGDGDKVSMPYVAVDLGLESGLKWADRNVGAESIEDYGDYFMWGSVTPDTSNVCDWEHCPFNSDSSVFDSQYFNMHKSEWVTENGTLYTLKPECDAAHVNMGGSWRMPTADEIRELLHGTAPVLEELNGVAGVRFASKTNLNSIFMPFNGNRRGSTVYGDGVDGNIWTSTLDSRLGVSDFSRSIYFYGDGDPLVDFNLRYGGFAVRGVC